MAKICVFLAEGCEEVEALTPVDLLRRAGDEVVTVSISHKKEVTGSHHVTMVADALFEEVDYEDVDMLVLPGGIPGTPNLRAHKGLEALIQSFDEQKKYLAAICAAPTIYGEMNLLTGREATCHTSMLDALRESGAQVVTDEPVVITDHIITSRGMGTAIDFALTLVTLLNGGEMAEKIQKGIVY